MKAANVAETVKSEHAVALLKQMYGEKRAEENAARYQLVADGLFQFHTSPPPVLGDPATAGSGSLVIKINSLCKSRPPSSKPWGRAARSGRPKILALIRPPKVSTPSTRLPGR